MKTCPRCSRPLIAGLRKVDVDHVQHVAFCPKCRFEELGDVVPGYWEVEQGWSLDVSGPGTSALTALRALRRVPELASVPLTTLVERLKTGPITVGPFSRTEGLDLQAELRAAGLIAELVGA